MHGVVSGEGLEERILEVSVDYFYKEGVREEGQVGVVIVFFRCQIRPSQQCVGLDHLRAQNMYQFQVKLG